MIKEELIKFFEDQAETASIALSEHLKLRNHAIYTAEDAEIAKYEAYYKAYKEAIFKTKQLKEN